MPVMAASLTRRWDGHSAGPIEVHLVSKELDVVGVEAGGVEEHVVGAGRHGALTWRSCDEEEIVPGWQRQHVVDHIPGSGLP